jgi:hypothetical protein
LNIYYWSYGMCQKGLEPSDQSGDGRPVPASSMCSENPLSAWSIRQMAKQGWCTLGSLLYIRALAIFVGYVSPCLMDLFTQKNLMQMFEYLLVLQHSDVLEACQCPSDLDNCALIAEVSGALWCLNDLENCASTPARMTPKKANTAFAKSACMRRCVLMFRTCFSA